MHSEREREKIFKKKKRKEYVLQRESTSLYESVLRICFQTKKHIFFYFFCYIRRLIILNEI